MGLQYQAGERAMDDFFSPRNAFKSCISSVALLPCFKKKIFLFFCVFILRQKSIKSLGYMSRGMNIVFPLETMYLDGELAPRPHTRL